MDILHMPPNKLPKVESIWVVLSVDKDGNEGVVAAPTPSGEIPLMPLITADRDNLPFITSMAKSVAKTSGMKMRLVRFTGREEEEIEP